MADSICDNNGGRLKEDVLEVVLPFDTQQNLSLQEALALFVDVAESYLSLVNNNKAIRPYLRNYPFTIDNLDLSIGVQASNFDWQANGKIALIAYREGSVYYAIFDHKDRRFIPLHAESFAAALELVKKGLEEEGAAMILEGLDPGR